jgi:hypothetical protein
MGSAKTWCRLVMYATLTLTVWRVSAQQLPKLEGPTDASAPGMFSPAVNVVPEPSSIGMMFLGSAVLGALMALRRTRRS